MPDQGTLKEAIGEIHEGYSQMSAISLRLSKMGGESNPVRVIQLYRQLAQLHREQASRCESAVDIFCHIVADAVDEESWKCQTKLSHPNSNSPGRA